MTSIGARLREERNRLCLSQADIGRCADVSKGAVVQWEKKEGATPNAEALAALASWDFDILYIITGQRQAGHAGNPVLGPAESRDGALDQFAASLRDADLRWAMLDLAGSALIRACGPEGHELPRQKLIFLLSETVIHAHAALGNSTAAMNGEKIFAAMASRNWADFLMLLGDLREEAMRRHA